MDVDAYVADEEAHWEAESRTRGCIALSIHIVRAAMWIQGLPEHRETAAGILAECDANKQRLGGNASEKRCTDLSRFSCHP
jgi:hypothetical protein